MPSYLNVVLLGDCLTLLRDVPGESVNAVVTDPPYGLGTREPRPEDIIRYLQGDVLDTAGDFMGKDWQIPPVAVWQECFRVLKPGGHLLSFGGTRTFDLISLGIRAAGFENRDTIASMFGGVLSWVHGQGFPKSLNLQKAFEKAGDVESAKRWAGWGTALKPAWEPILVFRKPLVESTVARQALTTDTGGLNIDATRVRHASLDDLAKHMEMVERIKERGGSMANSWKNSSDLSGASDVNSAGRWPSNLVLLHHPDCKRVGTAEAPAPVINRFDDGMKPFGGGEGHPYTQSGGGTEEVAVYECVESCPVRLLNEQSGDRPGMPRTVNRKGDSTKGYHGGFGVDDASMSPGFGDAGGASRFFPSFPGQEPPETPFFYTSKAGKKETTVDGQVENNHPTKKSLALMEWLVKLVCPKGGTVLDPYCGSGTTLVAATLHDMHFLGIEKDEKYHDIAVKRVGIVHERCEAERSQKGIFEFMEQIDAELDDDEDIYGEIRKS